MTTTFSLLLNFLAIAREISNFKMCDNDKSSNYVSADDDIENIVDSIKPSNKVFANDLLCEKILSNCSSSEQAKMRMVCSKFNDYFNDYITKFETIRMQKTGTKRKPTLKVTYGNNIKIITLKGHRIDSELLDKIVEMIPECEMSNVRKIVIRGRLSGYNDIWRLEDMLDVTSDVNQFFDKFEGLKHLEYCRVDFIHYSISSYEVVEYINRLKKLSVIDSIIVQEDLMNLVGTKIKHFCVSESMLRKNGIADLARMNKVTVYLNDKHWKEIVPVETQNIIESKYDPVPWYKMFQKELRLDEKNFISFDHYDYVKYIKLRKLKREGDEILISRTIAQLSQLPKLEKLAFDGYFTKQEIRTLIETLENCSKLAHIELRTRKVTTNLEDWHTLIKNLPKRIVCVKLDTIVDLESVKLLQSSLSDSLLNLELTVRSTILPDESMRIAFHSFKKLLFLKVNGVLFNAEKLAVLQGATTRTIVIRSGPMSFRLQEEVMDQGYSIDFKLISPTCFEWECTNYFEVRNHSCADADRLMRQFRHGYRNPFMHVREIANIMI